MESEVPVTQKVLETLPVGWSNRSNTIVCHLRKVSDFDSVIMCETEEKENVDNADGQD